MKFQNRVLIVACLLWTSAVLAGTAWMWLYESRPGVAAAYDSDWPASSSLQRDASRATLLMFAHPRCPCTRASLGELARIMARCHGQVRAQVLFTKPGGTSDGWEKTSSWRYASSIPGVCVRTDEAGAEAKRFGAVTSGQVLLFDREGRLRFHGGITESRGHAGDNDGSDAVVALLGGQTAARQATPVFGCSIFTPDAQAKVE